MKNELEVTDTWRAEDGATHLLILPPRLRGGDISTLHPSYHSGSRRDSLLQQVKLELSQLGQGFQFPWPDRSLMKCSAAPLAGSQAESRDEDSRDRLSAPTAAGPREDAQILLPSLHQIGLGIQPALKKSSWGGGKRIHSTSYAQSSDDTPHGHPCSEETVSQPWVALRRDLLWHQTASESDEAVKAAAQRIDRCPSTRAMLIVSSGPLARKDSQSGGPSSRSNSNFPSSPQVSWSPANVGDVLPALRCSTDQEMQCLGQRGRELRTKSNVAGDVPPGEPCGSLIRSLGAGMDFRVSADYLASLATGSTDPPSGSTLNGVKALSHERGCGIVALNEVSVNKGSNQCPLSASPPALPAVPAIWRESPFGEPWMRSRMVACPLQVIC